ncbi:hypothetical protein [Sporolactobacillus spathodeae]|uniref:Uncharacterized protein YoxC n=1 Tax=Sporolactobacillus spathodeae TaxID=1465502 RepID=A0ABS2Q6N3_9BACL|nr:hypothetical protein [Sporolactobacillus spathodeae]MBM7656652.1 uncharacterized protein YoxC [Sporolactobacillus spathodeae]
MVIVSLSLALVVCAIFYFIFSLTQIAKRLNGTLADLSKTTEKFREKGEALAKEKNRLDHTLSLIKLNLVSDKEKMQRTSRQVQQFTNLTHDDVYKLKKAIKRKA